MRFTRHAKMFVLKKIPRDAVHFISDSRQKFVLVCVGIFGQKNNPHAFRREGYLSLGYAILLFFSIVIRRAITLCMSARSAVLAVLRSSVLR